MAFCSTALEEEHFCPPTGMLEWDISVSPCPHQKYKRNKNDVPTAAKTCLVTWIEICAFGIWRDRLCCVFRMCFSASLMGFYHSEKSKAHNVLFCGLVLHLNSHKICPCHFWLTNFYHFSPRRCYHICERDCVRVHEGAGPSLYLGE